MPTSVHAIFDLLKKPDLSIPETRRIKEVAVQLLATLKAEKLRIDNWQQRESSRAAVQTAIRDFLWSDATGLPVTSYTDHEVEVRTGQVYRHIFRVYPTLPSPYFQPAASG